MCHKRQASKERNDPLPYKLGVIGTYLALYILANTSAKIEKWWQKRN